MNRDPIGIFDSGIGGLTVVKAVREILPGEDIIYLGDTARLPYGTKSTDAIMRFSIEDTQFLVDRGAKYVVIACYSAASVALDIVRERFPVPVIGVIQPGARRAMQMARTGKIGVIGTALTIYSGAYEKAFRDLGARVEILGKPCPLFVPLVEEGWLDHAVTRLVARDYLEPFVKDDIDTLLLGCTHYPLMMKVIKEIMGDINYVDASVEVGAELAQSLKDLKLANPGAAGSTAIYLTDLSVNFKEIGERFLGEPMKNFSRVSLKESH
ncbi:glutamate racemase [candidate division WOR-3 bacterium]|nr:glutamate racemase [candidate division WOR-3 bacterium]